MLAPIAAGGMASVWAARMNGAAGFRKIVAIKTMLPELAEEPEYRAMFLDEARVASKLRHPNVCETFDLGEQGATLFMAMEWVDGTSLHRVLRGAGKSAVPIAPALAARIVAGACAGLHAAHEAVDDDGSPLAVVHRDVSPQNILLSADGHVKVTDFGVAKATGKSHATAAGQAKGKLAYMAPEQLRCLDVDRRADVYSLGCVLYEITTGRKPFDGDTDATVIQAILGGVPARPSDLVKGYPAELERIVARATAKDRRDRFASAEGLRIALERWLATTGTGTSERDVAVLVHERCGDEIARRRAAIHAHAGGALDAELPADDLVSVRKVDPFAATHLERRRGGGLFGLAFGIVVMALAFGSLAWKRPIEPQVFAHTAPEPVAAPVLAALAAAEPALGGDVEPRSAPAARAAEGSRVTFRVDAPDVRLVVDGEPLEPGVTTVERPSVADQTKIVLVKAEGRVDRLFVVDSTTPDVLDVQLAAAEPSASAE